jgi:Tfp pilus assembly protein PilN
VTGQVAPWLAGVSGLCVGILIGLVIDDVYDIYRANRKTRTPHMERRPLLLLWLLIVSLVANAVVGGTLIFARAKAEEAQRTATTSLQRTNANAAELEKFTVCVAAFNQRFTEAYTARLKPSTEASDALDRLIRAVANDDRAEFRKALTAYVALREKVKAEQASNPYPPLPLDYCGPVPRKAK